MSERESIVVQMGYPVAMNPLYEGEVKDGGARVRVWAHREADWQGEEKARVLVSRSYHGRKHTPSFDDDAPTVELSGADTIKLNRDQAAALVTELQLALAAIALSQGEPWAEREIAPGILRAPEVRGA